MPIDARLRDELERVMWGIDTEVEPFLHDARRRGRRRIVIRRILAAVTLVAVIAVIAVAAPRVLDRSGGLRQPATTPSSVNGMEQILGTWRSEYTCEEFVQGFQRAGIGDLAARWLVNDGLQKGPVHQLANGGHPCRGAVRFQRTHTFLPDGYLRTYQGQTLADDCRCYDLIDSHTFVVPGDRKLAPDITLQYRIDGGTLTFDAVIPDACSSVKCRGHFAWAIGNYAVSTWHRAT